MKKQLQIIANLDTVRGCSSARHQIFATLKQFVASNVVNFQ